METPTLADVGLIDIPFELESECNLMTEENSELSGTDKIYLSFPFAVQDLPHEKLVSLVFDENNLPAVIDQQVLLQSEINSLEFQSEKVNQSSAVENHGKSTEEKCLDVEKILQSESQLKNYLCDLCNLRFETRRLLQKHKLNHLTEKPFKCSECPESFNFENNLIPHLATHDPENPFCPICKKRFKRVAGLKAHIWVHHSEDSLFCQECGEEFTCQIQLDNHIQEHVSDLFSPSKSYHCNKCDIRLDSLVAYKAHMKELQHKKKSRKKVKKKKLKVTKRHHEKTYQCLHENCQKTFAKPSQLARHVRIHTGERPYECSVCTKAFSQKGSLQIHMLKHSGLKPYKCEFCNSCFTQKGNLQAHINRLHDISDDEGTTFKCDHCSCLFRNANSYSSHLMKVHNITPTEHKKSMDNIACLDKGVLKSQEIQPDVARESQEKQPEPEALDSLDPCGDLFKPLDQDLPQDNVGKILVDNNTNTEFSDVPISKMNKMHKCSDCTKQFKRPSDLLRHSKIHLKEKTYKCTLCPEKFHTKSALLKHRPNHSVDNTILVQTTEKKNFKCGKCYLSFNSLDDKENHERSHIQPETTLISLEDFSIENTKFVLSPDGILELVHENPITTVLTKEQNFGNLGKCERCNETFKTSHLLKTHMMIEPFKCEKCERKFCTESSLKSHFLIHAYDEDLKCKECGLVCLSDADLKKHEESHSLSVLFCCPFCGQVFRNYPACEKHVLTSHSEKADLLTAKPLVLHVVKDGEKKIVEKPKRNGVKLYVPDIPALQSQNEVSKVESPAEPQVQSSSQPEMNFNNDLSELIKSLQLGHQFMISPNDASFENEKSTSNQALFEQDNQPLITVNNDQAFDGCIFLQNNDGTTQVLDTTLTELNKCDISVDNLTQISVESLVELGLINKSSELPGSDKTYEENGNFDNEGNKLMDASVGNNILIDMNRNEGIFINPSLVGFSNETGSLSNPLNFESPSSEQSEFQEIAQNKFVEDEFSMKVIEPSEIFNTEKSMVNQWYSCSICDENFDTPEQIIAHCKIHSDETTIEVCSSEPIKKKRKPNRPEVRTLTEEERKAAIMATPLTFSEQVLREAIVEYEKINNQEYGDDDLKEDTVKVVHGNVCSHCGKTFKKPSDLVRHNRIHTGELPYKCPDCDKSFNLKSTAVCHIRTHTRNRFYSCHICKRSFASPGSLKLHMRLHTGSKPFMCPICGAKFRTSGHKKTHLISHLRQASQQPAKNKRIEEKPKKYILSPDGVLTENENLTPTADFLTKAIKGGLLTEDIEKSAYTILLMNNIGNHDGSNDLPEDVNDDIVSVHPPLKPPGTVKLDCAFCDKIFYKQANLEKHVAKLHKGKKLKCGICQKEFSRKKDLEFHTLQHGLAKAISCQSCSEVFESDSALQSHQCSKKTVMKTFSLDLSSIVQDLFFLPSE